MTAATYVDSQGGVFLLDGYSGTDDQKMAAALTDWHAAGGGTILLAPRAHTFASQWAIPNDGANPPNQKSLQIKGSGASHHGSGGSPSGGTIVDFTAATGPAKIDSRGHGLLCIEHITFRDTSGGTNPFIQVTNTTLQVESCEFFGSKDRTACDQDAIVLGGGTRNTDNTDTGKYDGYGSSIVDCFFDHIRRCVWFRPGANNVIVRDNTIWNHCGAPDATYGAIDLLGSNTGSIVGNLIEGNTIEVTGYPTGIRVGPYARVNAIVHNGFYDPTATTVQAIYFDDNAPYNFVIAGYSDDSFPHVVEHANIVDKNTFLTAHQTQTSTWGQPWRFANNLTVKQLVQFDSNTDATIQSQGTGKVRIKGGTSGSADVIIQTRNAGGTLVDRFRVKANGSVQLVDTSGNTILEVTAAGALGFFGATATAKPTGVAVTAEGIHAALVSLGLIGA